MRIIDATVANARRCRDWGRIEACVTLTYRARPGMPPRTRRLLTSVPADGTRDLGLRARLVADAVKLAEALASPAPSLADAA